jgi:pyruvate kinase
MKRCTKIVCTIGPASQDEETMRLLIQSGLDVARLNFSHGEHADHARVYHLLRKVSVELDKPITILQDLQGPKIRTGHINGGCAELTPGNPFILTTLPVTGDENCVSVDYPDLPEALKPGDRILLDDGNLELVVITTSEEQVETRVVLGGTLYPNKGVNLPGAHLEIPGFTEKDEQDLAFGLELGVNMVAISFVRSETDVKRVRTAIKRLSPNRADVPIIAKLERPEALDNLEPIIHAADGVMVARGDLGVEMPPEYVPIAQKRIIESANRHAKLVITATQMLDSMIHNPRPTRAEASDVANAILDGTDAVMLSGETATGKYPVKAVEIMNAIALQAENVLDRWGHWTGSFEHVDGNDDTYFMTRAARELAHDRNVSAIAIFTKSGRTALLMSKTRPGVPILAFTPEQETYNRLSLYWGVTPHLVPHANSIEEMLTDVEELMLNNYPIQTGQQIILICGFPVQKIRATNLAILHTIGETL